MTASLRRTSGRTPRDSPAAIHAPLFHELLARLDATERHVVLDLGGANTAMLDRLGRSPCRVEIADMAHFGGVDRLNATEPGPALAEVAESLLPPTRQDDPVDIVFCWDLPNYLALTSLSALMQAIGHRARRGALAHALICYADRDMPERPGRYIPTADDDLIDHNPASETIAAPRYSPEELGKNMGRFMIDRARLLGNGMQEFLFRLG